MSASGKYFGWAHILIGVCIGAASVSVVAKEACPDKVRITFPDVSIPPFYNGSGLNFEDPPGYLVEWVRKAVAQTDCKVNLELKRRPVKRGYQEIEYNETDILAMAGYTPERFAILAFPIQKSQIDKRISWYQTTSYLWVRKGDTSVKWDGHQLGGPAGFKVGVPIGTKLETIASQHGWAQEPGTTAMKTVDKLLAGRMPVALLPDVTVASLPDDIEAKLERLEPPVESIELYSPSSKSFYAQYPEFMDKFWLALCKVARAEKALPEQKRLPACH